MICSASSSSIASVQAVKQANDSSRKDGSLPVITYDVVQLDGFLVCLGNDQPLHRLVPQSVLESSSVRELLGEGVVGSGQSLLSSLPRNLLVHALLWAFALFLRPAGDMSSYAIGTFFVKNVLLT